MRTRAFVALCATQCLLASCASEKKLPADGGEVVGEGKQYIFVTASEADAIHVFDWETLDPVTQIAVGDEPMEIIATPDGATVWAISRAAGELTVLDAATLAVRHRVRLGVRPVHSFVEPSYQRVFIGNDGSAEVSVVDLATGAEERILTGNGHHKMAIAPDGDGSLRFVYVSNISDATLTVLSPSLDVVTQVSVGPAPHGMDYSHHTRRVYNCSGDENNSVEVVATEGAEAHTIVSRIPLPARCSYLHVEADGRYAYATIGATGELAQVDLDNETVVTFAAGESPDKFEIDGNVAWVANVTTPTVTVVNLVDPEQTASVGVGHAHDAGGHGHRGLQLFEDRLFVPNQADGTVTVIDTSTRTVLATLEGVQGVSGIAIAGPRGGTTYPR